MDLLSCFLPLPLLHPNQGNFANIVKYAERLPEDISTYLVKTAVGLNMKLQKTRAFADWIVNHEDVLF